MGTEKGEILIVTLTEEEIGKQARNNSELMLQAEEIEVSDKETHGTAQEFLKGCSTLERKITDLFAEPKRKAHEAHKSITKAEKELLEPVGRAKTIVTGKVDAYEGEQRRIAEEAERKLREEARKIEEDRKLAEAEAAEKDGEHEVADAILSEPVSVPVVKVQTETAKVEGVSQRANYKAEVTDLLALVKHVAAHPECVNLLMPNMPAINSMARAQKEAMKIPGVRVVKETIRSFQRS